MLARNAHSIAVFDCFFVFRQQIKRFFRLLDGISGTSDFEREEVHPVLKAMFVHAPVKPDEILHVRAVGVYRFQAALAIEFVDRLLALAGQFQFSDQLPIRENRGRGSGPTPALCGSRTPPGPSPSSLFLCPRPSPWLSCLASKPRPRTNDSSRGRCVFSRSARARPPNGRRPYEIYLGRESDWTSPLYVKPQKAYKSPTP